MGCNGDLATGSEKFQIPGALYSSTFDITGQAFDFDIDTLIFDASTTGNLRITL